MGELAILPTKTNVVSVRVNHLLFINGFTQAHLAVRLHLTPAAVGNKMQRRARWNLDEIDAMADIFDVSTDYLLGRVPIESAIPVNEAVPASEETGTVVVAGRGFEPLTSGL